VIEVFVLPALAAVYVAWDLGSDWIKAQKAALDTSSLKMLHDTLSEIEERHQAAIAKLEQRVVSAEKQAHDVKNRLEAAAAAAGQRRARWDAARPVKIG
jgi:predicted  nucleic acid-binding Zn-ribbon protein